MVDLYILRYQQPSEGRKVTYVKLSKEPFLNSVSYLLEVFENQHSVLFVSFVFVDIVKIHLSMVKLEVLKN